VNILQISKNYYLLIFIFGLIPAIVCQFFIKGPGTKVIHIRNFRYGKDATFIRCNRSDTHHITFSTDDTGHSFFLQELVFVAKRPGILNYLVSISNYRCHIWCDLSLRNLKNTWQHKEFTSKQLFYITLPISIYITLTAILMILFFTN
jgi:hypothetical protein